MTIFKITEKKGQKKQASLGLKVKNILLKMVTSSTFYSAFRLKNAYLIVIYIKKLYKEVL